MDAIPAKLTPKLVAEVDLLVKEGWYASRSELLRDAVRKMVEEKRLFMLEESVREDIEWGLHGK